MPILIRGIAVIARNTVVLIVVSLLFGYNPSEKGFWAVMLGIILTGVGSAFLRDVLCGCAP